jgi:hypothetical protein
MDFLVKIYTEVKLNQKTLPVNYLIIKFQDLSKIYDNQKNPSRSRSKRTTIQTGAMYSSLNACCLV